MKLDLEPFKPLVGVLLEKGVPLLANAFLPGVGGAVAGIVMPSLVQAFGLSSDATPEIIAKAIQTDPDADAKLKQITEEHSELLDFAQKAIDANQAALAIEPSFWGRLYVGGWRPAMGWSGVFTATYQTVASVRGWALVPIDHFIGIMAVWTGLAGLRGVEFVKGVARTSLSSVAETVAKKVVKRG